MSATEPKLPFLRLYTGDWLKDPCVSRCGPATRGIWIDLLCAIHELGRSGQVTGTAEELARICRCTAADFVDAANELRFTKTANVSVRDGRYTIVNRRMKKQSKSAQKSRKNASLASGGRKPKPGGQKTYGNNKSPPISKSISEAFSSSTKPIGDCAKEALLKFDLVLAEKRNKFIDVIERLFHPDKREAKTFANIAVHLAMLVQFHGANPNLFDRAIEWAEQASKTTNVRNKKGLFVAKIKKETGYKAQKKLL